METIFLLVLDEVTPTTGRNCTIKIFDTPYNAVKAFNDIVKIKEKDLNENLDKINGGYCSFHASQTGHDDNNHINIEVKRIEDFDKYWINLL